MTLDDLQPKQTNRVFVCGMTGSGKSELMKRLLATRESVLIFDAKDEINPRNGWHGYKRFTKIQRMAWANPLRGVYSPNIHELVNPRCHEAFFYLGFKRRNTIIYVDEAYAVTDGQELPFWYKTAITRGRSRGIEVWSASQRPIDIPQFLMSESENKYIFYLEMPQDVKKVREMTGIEDSLIRGLSMDNHEFIYRKLNKTSGKLRLNLKG